VAHAGSSCPGNPDALGISRVVEIDTTGGPGFGFEHFKTHDFLREGEVVLTFDDGPWPRAAISRTTEANHPLPPNWCWASIGSVFAVYVDPRQGVSR
jgi:hypothetical protein